MCLYFLLLQPGAHAPALGRVQRLWETEIQNVCIQFTCSIDWFSDVSFSLFFAFFFSFFPIVNHCNQYIRVTYCSIKKDVMFRDLRFNPLEKSRRLKFINICFLQCAADMQAKPHSEGGWGRGREQFPQQLEVCCLLLAWMCLSQREMRKREDRLPVMLSLWLP